MTLLPNVLLLKILADTLLITKNLNVDKARGWGNLSFRMIEIFSKSLTLLLILIFFSMLHEGVFAEGWKKSNAVPIHIKDSKNLTKNYQPISLSILSKVERLVFNSLYYYFISPTVSRGSYQIKFWLQSINWFERNIPWYFYSL